jgi:hypothetical protein
LVDQLAALIEHGSGVAGLVGIDPDDYAHPATSPVNPDGEAKEGNPTWSSAVLC